MRILRPPKLKHGDLIGVVAPASPASEPSKIERGVRYLETLGYRVKLGNHITQVNGYLAGEDQERVSDLHEMFSDKKVKAIVCLRGGYGTPRLLSLINYHLIARNPKVFVGFSDITALQLAFWKRCRLITFHGPMLAVEMANTMDPLTEDLFWRSVTSPKAGGVLSLPGEPVTLFKGKTSGRLLGGNLSLVVSLLGTRYQPDFRGSILFIEDSDEEPYRIDRMLTQLRNASVLSRTKAILAGQFTDCLPKDLTKPSLTLEQILDEVARASSKPFLSNLAFGHIARKITLPVGLNVRVDADARTIEYLEPAVR
jgi:muramoyltetrapeptide carboxypeptidase